MYKKTVTYTDFNDVERKEDFYFNLSEAEIMEMELSVTGGLTGVIDRIIKAKDTPSIVKLVKELILKAYGEKSDDGRRFIKSEELSKAFEQTEAYSKIFMEMATDDKACSDFINGIAPKGAATMTEAEKRQYLEERLPQSDVDKIMAATSETDNVVPINQ